ncbi:MAG: hypothetical protein ACKOCO_12455, partial [Bacteroidota bacterium]
MKFFTRIAASLLGLVLISMLSQSCSDLSTKVSSSRDVKEYSHKVMSSWNDLFLQIERYAAGYRP